MSFTPTYSRAPLPLQDTAGAVVRPAPSNLPPSNLPVRARMLERSQAGPEESGTHVNTTARRARRRDGRQS